MCIYYKNTKNDGLNVETRDSQSPVRSIVSFINFSNLKKFLKFLIIMYAIAIAFKGKK